MCHLASATRAALLLGFLVGCTRVPPGTSSTDAPRIVLLSGAVVDVERGIASGPSAVVIVRSRIVDVVPRARFERRAADSVIDLGSATLLPGFIDAHVHLTIGGTIRDNANADLAAGFTTVIDQGARSYRVLRVRDSINAGLIAGPRILAAGLWTGAKNGVCEFAGIGLPAEPTAFRRRVEQNDSAGANLTKLCITGWPATAFANPLATEIDIETARAAVEEAHHRRHRVVAHSIGLAGVQLALAAGVDGLAHAAYLDSATAKRMAAASMFMIPTLASLASGDASPVSTGLIRATQIAANAGVVLVFGTDGGVIPHGHNAMEFAALARAGLTPATLVRMATVNAARAFGIGDSVGVLKAGMVADIIALEDSPLSNAAALTRPTFVMARGVVHLRR